MLPRSLRISREKRQLAHSPELDAAGLTGIVSFSQMATMADEDVMENVCGSRCPAAGSEYRYAP
jgi:hypothetical protein